MSLTNRVTVQAGWCALVYRKGTLSRVLDPGTHRLYGAVSTVPVDLRERLVTLAPQEVLTSDAVSLRITVVLRIVVADAVAFVEKADDPVAAVYLAAQIALRENAAGLAAEDVMRRSARIDAEAIREAAREAGARTGVDVLDAYVKDVIVPAEIRTAAMQLVTAKSTVPRSWRRRAPRRQRCGRWPTQASCSTPTPRWRSCGWSSRFRTARGSCWRSAAPIPTRRLTRTNPLVRRRGGAPRQSRRHTPPRRRPRSTPASRTRPTACHRPGTATAP